MEDKKYNIVYSSKAKKYKEAYVLLAWYENYNLYNSHSHSSLYALKRTNLYKLIGNSFYYDTCDFKYTLNYLVSNLMRLIIKNHIEEPMACILCCNKKITTFETDFYEGRVFDSELDNRLAFYNQKWNNENDIKFALSNTIGLFFDGRTLYVLDKNNYRKVFDNNLLNSIYSIDNIFYKVVGRNREKADKIIYSEDENYWFIRFGYFRMVLNKEQEESPFIRYNVKDDGSEVADKIEIKTWLKDDIISRIPNIEFSLVSNEKAVKEANALSLEDSLKEFYGLSTDGDWKIIKSRRYICEYSESRFFHFKIKNKKSEKLACLCYYV